MKMKELQQEMFDLFVDGLTLEQIATAYEVSVDQVYQTIRWFKNI